MKNLIFTDSHICRENIEELATIFAEIMSYKADRIICLGDFYEKKTLSPEELIFGTSVIKQLKDNYSEVYMLEGNHDTPTIRYLRSLGVEVFETFILDNNYYGHFFVEESIKSFNSVRRKLSELEQYNKIFLGHQHSFQILGKNRFHIGSPIWVDFGEVDDIKKVIILLEDDKVNIIELKSPIPMIDIFKMEDLDKIEDRRKVRYVIKDFKQLKKETDKLEQYKNKFYSFKIKLDFENTLEEVEISPKKNINEIINSWLDKIEDKEVKQELELSFKENR